MVTDLLSTHTYDWDICIDDECPVHYQGTVAGSMDDVGILLENLSSGRHKIMITPHGDPFPGWGNAFGHSLLAGTLSGSNSLENCKKIISVDAPLTTMAFAPKTTESTTSASYMFAFIFCYCQNLKTSVKIIDTYKLPATITDLSSFLCATHAISNAMIKEPIDLSGLAVWLNNNNSITDISSFLYQTHSGNTALEKPIDITPLAGWFSNNTSITTIEYFINSTYEDNIAMTAPVDLTPLRNWFAANRQINAETAFGYIHKNNPALKLTGQKIFPNWLKSMKNTNGNPIIIENQVYSVLYQAFYLDAAQTGDTGEPQFEDGSVLSSMGTPPSNIYTYTNRTGITVSSNWK
jgi:hypothetical protein